MHVKQVIILTTGEANACHVLTLKDVQKGRVMGKMDVQDVSMGTSKMDKNVLSAGKP